METTIYCYLKWKEMKLIGLSIGIKEKKMETTRV